MEAVQRRRKCAFCQSEQADVDSDTITVHSLRHLGAERHDAASGDGHETQRFLDHARPETTSIYCSS